MEWVPPVITFHLFSLISIVPPPTPAISSSYPAGLVPRERLPRRVCGGHAGDPLESIGDTHPGERILRGSMRPASLDDFDLWNNGASFGAPPAHASPPICLIHALHNLTKMPFSGIEFVLYRFNCSPAWSSSRLPHRHPWQLIPLTSAAGPGRRGGSVRIRCRSLTPRQENCPTIVPVATAAFSSRLLHTAALTTSTSPLLRRRLSSSSLSRTPGGG
jgi:hypothetical protein